MKQAEMYGQWQTGRDKLVTVMSQPGLTGGKCDSDTPEFEKMWQGSDSDNPFTKNHDKLVTVTLLSRKNRDKLVTVTLENFETCDKLVTWQTSDMTVRPSLVWTKGECLNFNKVKDTRILEKNLLILIWGFL